MTDCDALSALSPGVPLWLIPPLDQSEWSTRIDWYLGFQLRRGLPHKRFEFSDDIRQLMESYENPLPRIPRTEDAPLMVASETKLPNHQTVLVPMSEGGAKSWAETCFQVWKGLGRPPARVFLPKGLTREIFAKGWPEDAAGADLQIVTS